MIASSFSGEHWHAAFSSDQGNPMGDGDDFSRGAGTLAIVQSLNLCGDSPSELPHTLVLRITVAFVCSQPSLS